MLSLDTLEIIRHRYDWAARAMAGHRALEIGCGAGLGLGYFSDQAGFLVAGDYSEENLHVCASRDGVSRALVRYDAHALPFADASFDIVVALAMVYYLRMDELLAEAARVLRPGGRFLFCTSNKNVSGFVAAPHTVGYCSIPELTRLLGTAGFQADFHGAFPNAGGSAALSAARGFAKNAAKTVVSALPGGRNTWARMRRRAEGMRGVLPADVRDLPAPGAQLVPLDAGKINRIYRVIYVSARKPQTPRAPRS